MNVLANILKESKVYYLDIQHKLDARLGALVIGNIKKRTIYGNTYYYLQQRIGQKIVHTYLGKTIPEKLLADIRASKKEKERLRAELARVHEALRVLKRTEGKKHGKRDTRHS